MKLSKPKEYVNLLLDDLIMNVRRLTKSLYDGNVSHSYFHEQYDERVTRIRDEILAIVEQSKGEV